MPLLEKRITIQFLVYVFITITGIQAGHAQFTITDFLKTTSESPVVINDSTSLSQLQNINYNLSLFNGIELRTETRDLLLKRQEYAVRFKPNAIGAISKQKNVYKNKLEEVQLSNKLNFNKELKTRYLVVLDYIFIKKQITLQSKRKTQLKDALLVYQASIYETDFDIKDLIDVEEALLETDAYIIALENQLSNYTIIIQQLSGSNSVIESINMDELIAPDQIVNSPIEIIDNEESFKVALKKLELETIESEIALDAAKSRQIIDFFQAKYGGKRSELFDENFSIGVGIELPFIGKNKKKRGDYLFEKLNEESELEILKLEDRNKKQVAAARFKAAVTNYKNQYQQTQESSTKTVLEKYKTIEGVSPASLLKLEMLLLKKEISALKSQETMYRAYIDMLAAHELLYNEPYINYLSARLQTFSF